MVGSVAQGSKGWPGITTSAVEFFAFNVLYAGLGCLRGLRVIGKPFGAEQGRRAR